MKALWISTMVLAVLVAMAVPAGAQPVISAKSGVIAAGDGAVYVGDKPWEPSLSQFESIKENSVVRTELGRVEVLLTPGAFFRMGEQGSFRLISNRLIDTRLELLGGSAVVEIDAVDKDTKVTVVSHEATVTFPKPGLYRFDSAPARIKVFKGTAQVQIGDHSVDVNGGKMLSLGGQTASAEKFDAEDTDALDNWSRRRGELVARSNVSAANSMAKSSLPHNGSVWGYNSYYGMYTWLPVSGRIYSPYGFSFYGPDFAYQIFTMPQYPVYNSGYDAMRSTYPTMAPTYSGYSGAVASAPMSMPSSAPAASAGSSAASAAASSSVGHGSAPSGGAHR